MLWCGLALHCISISENKNYKPTSNAIQSIAQVFYLDYLSRILPLTLVNSSFPLIATSFQCVWYFVCDIYHKYLVSDTLIFHSNILASDAASSLPAQHSISHAARPDIDGLEMGGCVSTGVSSHPPKHEGRCVSQLCLLPYNLFFY